MKLSPFFRMVQHKVCSVKHLLLHLACGIGQCGLRISWRHVQERQAVLAARKAWLHLQCCSSRLLLLFDIVKDDLCFNPLVAA